MVTDVLVKPMEQLKNLKQKDKEELLELRSKNNLSNLFKTYLNKINEKDSIISSIDNKILQALQINPLIEKIPRNSSKRFYAPTRKLQGIGEKREGKGWREIKTKPKVN